MTIYLLAQVFSAIGALCVAISSFAKSKNKMLVWQLPTIFSLPLPTSYWVAILEL